MNDAGLRHSPLQSPRASEPSRLSQSRQVAPTRQKSRNRSRTPAHLLEGARLFRSPISDVPHKLETAAESTGITLYQANLRSYQRSRNGVPVEVAAGKAHETVYLIDSAHPEQNDFTVAEEVTGGCEYDGPWAGVVVNDPSCGLLRSRGGGR